MYNGIANISSKMLLLIILHVRPGVQFLSHMEILFLIFWGNSIQFLPFSTKSLYKVFDFSASSSSYFMFIFNSSHPNSLRWHPGFDLHFILLVVLSPISIQLLFICLIKKYLSSSFKLKFGWLSFMYSGH